MRPPAPTTRCHGRPFAPQSARTVRRAAPGKPAAFATSPYVVTLPRGIRAITARNRARTGTVARAGLALPARTPYARTTGVSL